MSKESDHLASDIACLDRRSVLASLVATTGTHCEVWRSAGTLTRDGAGTAMDFVIKSYRGTCALPEVRSLARQYRDMRTHLEDIVPETLFIATRIDGAPSVCALAEHVHIWFDIANPGNEDEAIPLLRALPKARGQLSRFVEAAARWRASANPRVINLFGAGNLVLDVDRDVRYLDSFHVFFFEDMLHLLGEPDPELAHKIQVCTARLDYLRRVLDAAGAQQ